MHKTETLHIIIIYHFLTLSSFTAQHHQHEHKYYTILQLCKFVFPFFNDIIDIVLRSTIILSFTYDLCVCIALSLCNGKKPTCIKEDAGLSSVLSGFGVYGVSTGS